MEVPVTITVTAEAVGTTVTAMVEVAVMGTATTTVMVIHTATEAARTLAGVKLCRLDVFYFFGSHYKVNQIHDHETTHSKSARRRRGDTFKS